MTKKRNARNTKSAAEATTGAYESAFKALSGLQSKLEIPKSAREFVKRTAATAKERAAAMHDGANKVAGVIEGAIVDGVTGVADVNRKLIHTAHDDTEAALAAIDKLAAAKSLAEANRLTVDYSRQRALRSLRSKCEDRRSPPPGGESCRFASSGRKLVPQTCNDEAPNDRTHSALCRAMGTRQCDESSPARDGAGKRDRAL